MWHTHTAIILLTILCMGIDGSPSWPQIPTKDFTGQFTYKVARVGDGGIISLMMGCFVIRARLIGVEIPETKHPEKPVEPYGVEATMFLTNLLLGEEVYVEQEPGMTVDKHGRSLVHPVYLYRAPDGLFVNLEIVRQGYARVEAPPAFQYIGLFTYYEQIANAIGKGLWGKGWPAWARSVEPRFQPPGMQPSPDEAMVYVARLGTNYHLGSCSYLSDSKIPIRLKEAKARGYKPCSRCKPLE